jgi:hypothetical protein
MSDDTPGSIAVPDDAAVLDRIEVGPEGAAHAVLLVGPHEVELVVARALLPEGAVEGDWLRLALTPDATLSALRREALSARMESIRATRRGGRFD